MRPKLELTYLRAAVVALGLENWPISLNNQKAVGSNPTEYWTGPMFFEFKIETNCETGETNLKRTVCVNK